MASADVQILGTGSKAAPLDYVLPSGSELLLKAVRADFNGAGAGSAFLPALEIISDAGHSVGVYPTDVAVAAGASASVSFAPFLRNASVATVLHTFNADLSAGAGLAVSGVPQVVQGWSFATSDADKIAFDFPPPNPKQLRFLNLLYGYTFTVTVVWDAFVGSRTLTAGSTDIETAWQAPQSLTNGEAQQFITGYLRPYPVTPTSFNVSLVQTSGVNQTWQSVEAVFQAVEFIV